jgi:hypothetical protein
VHRAALAAVASVLFGAAHVLAQSGDRYLEVVHGYSADPAAAIVEASELSRAEITRGARLCRSPLDAETAAALGHELGCSRQQFKTAAMLHATVAQMLVDRDPALAVFHIDTGEALLTALQPTMREVEYRPTPDDDLFIARWYAFNVRLRAVTGQFSSARALLTRALSRYPKSPDLYVARGVLTANNPRRGGPRPGVTAADDYRRALDFDPANARARLRLAWSHFLERDTRAFSEVSTAIRDAPDREIRYLGLLLRGMMTEQQRGAGDAIPDYEEARRQMPAAQSACVALSHAHDVAGHANVARRLAIECLTLGTERGRTLSDLEFDVERADPWWRFPVGLNDFTMDRWLQEQAQ